MSETKTLNDLPEGIIIKILTFLPTIYAIRTSLISKQFLNLWHQIPILNFTDFPSPLTSRSITRQSFADFITQTLILRPNSIPFHTFSLHFDYRHSTRLTRDVNSWIRRALNSNVSVLRIDFNPIRVYDSRDDDTSSDDDLPDEAFASYQFHFSDLKNRESVEVLELSYCDILWPKCDTGNRRVYTDNTFSSITSVTLNSVSLTDDDLYAFITSVVNLEYLSLAGVYPLTNFRIHSRKLKELDLGVFMVKCNGPAVGSLEICCPSLLKISFSTFLVEDYRVLDMSSLVEADIGHFYFCGDDAFYVWWEVMQMLRVSCVERLVTPNVKFSRDGWLELLDAEDFSNCSAFKNLKRLELKTAFDEDAFNGILAFLEVCSALETLVIIYGPDSNENFSEEFKNRVHKVHIPNLQKVEMKYYKATENELYFVKLLKLHKVVLREIVGYPPIENGKLIPPIVL